MGVLMLMQGAHKTAKAPRRIPAFAGMDYAKVFSVIPLRTLASMCLCGKVFKLIILFFFITIRKLTTMTPVLRIPEERY